MKYFIYLLLLGSISLNLYLAWALNEKKLEYNQGRINNGILYLKNMEMTQKIYGDSIPASLLPLRY